MDVLKPHFALLALAMLGTSCAPEITANTYYCGPEQLCPEGLQCHLGDLEHFSYSCEAPLLAEPFACPETTLDREPDETPADGYSLGVLSCGSQITSDEWGCIDKAQDVDHIRFSKEDLCAGNSPRFSATLRFPVGTAPLTIGFVNNEGTMLKQGVNCTDGEPDRGSEILFIDDTDLPVGEYWLRIQLDQNANADCDGSCSFNRYKLVIAAPLN
jgi:hypothetical protein